MNIEFVHPYHFGHEKWTLTVWGTYPRMPSSFSSFGAPSLSVLAQPGFVWIRTLTASIGAKAMSAKNSALADAAK